MTTVDRLRAKLAQRLTLEVLGEDRDWTVSYLGRHFLYPDQPLSQLADWHVPGAIICACRCEECLIGRLKRSVFCGREDWRKVASSRRQDLAGAFPKSSFLGAEGFNWLKTVNVCMEKMCDDLKEESPLKTTESGAPCTTVMAPDFQLCNYDQALCSPGIDRLKKNQESGEYFKHSPGFYFERHDES